MWFRRKNCANVVIVALSRSLISLGFSFAHMALSAPVVAVGKPKIRKPRQEKTKAAGQEKQEKQDNGKTRWTPRYLYKAIADKTKGDADNVKTVFDALFDLIVDQLRGEGKFIIPGILRFKIKATKARVETKRKLLGKEVTLKAKPAGKKLLTTAMKQLKTRCCEC